ncbi:MAG TPA: hypothetical protein VM619_08340 [Luteimonas sp.]|nr:hypothetical protein [Luteimonas sp.]
MPPQAIAMHALRSLLALALAGAAFALGNWAGGELGDRLPLPGGAVRLAWDLGWVFVAGIAAAWVVAKLAPRAPRLHVLAWCLLLLGVGACAALRMGDDWPWWFSAGLLAGAPLQGWLGARLARRRAGGAPRVPRTPPEGT